MAQWDRTHGTADWEATRSAPCSLEDLAPAKSKDGNAGVMCMPVSPPNTDTSQQPGACRTAFVSRIRQGGRQQEV